MKVRSLGCIAFTAGLLAAPLGAQGAPAEGHTGFHAAVGAGFGSVGLSCNGCDDSRESSLALMLRFGGAVRPGVVLSGEIDSWSKEISGVTAGVTWISLVAQYYPNPSEGFYLKGGVGGGSLQAAAFVSGVGSVKIETTNFGVVAGLGYDVHLSKGFSLTPFADVLYAAGADAKVNGSSSGATLGANMVHIGLAASWR
jgi:hypothetical protein